MPAFEIDVDQKYENDEYQLSIKNPVHCPLRFLLTSPDEEVNEILSDYSPLYLDAKADSTIIIKGKGDLEGKVKIGMKWGNSNLPITNNSLASLPYPKGKRYKLLQGNNSNPTHHTFGSRYAFDFTLKIGDTIASTQNGYVVGLIDGYSGWGMSDRWKPFGNQVLVYDTTSHLFAMYGHIKQDGGLVKIGDYVTVGQPIALSGKTGQTTEAHLHFNIFQAHEERGGLKSYPLDSIGKYEVKTLKRNQWMEN
ncbi:hypothetical protein GCM10007940_44270 [Portibacter lacus]|uniref:M23ase beta-sheet core domain-containing protein n=1 Tax=Portibacter lacus TaxID=1099794 RepID=A0AA37WFC5_9BACT|nr:hypothetical protein GCM10007940_44270 [Portibacter lacus]